MIVATLFYNSEVTKKKKPLANSEGQKFTFEGVQGVKRLIFYRDTKCDVRK